MFIEKIKAVVSSILAKIGVISEHVNTYIQVAIKIGSNLQNILSGEIAGVKVSDIVPEQYQYLVADIERVLPKAIAYLTASDAVLNAGTPDQMLAALLRELQKDTAGVQTTKLMRLIQEIVGLLDNNVLARSVYDFLVQKYFTAGKIGVSLD